MSHIPSYALRGDLRLDQPVLFKFSALPGVHTMPVFPSKKLDIVTAVRCPFQNSSVSGCLDLGGQ